MTTGWAIKDAATGEIDVSTVSPDRRSAIINWLFLRRRVPVSNAMGDGLIEVVWEAHSDKGRRAKAVPVRIEQGQ